MPRSLNVSGPMLQRPNGSKTFHQISFALAKLNRGARLILGYESCSTGHNTHRADVLIQAKFVARLPMIVIMYILNYLNRNNIALKGDEFQMCVSILLVGYLLMQGTKMPKFNYIYSCLPLLSVLTC